MKTKLFAMLLVLSFLLCGCSEKASESAGINDTPKATKNIFAMNTYITLTAYGENAEPALTDAESKIKELDSLLSVTDVNSEIYALNHSVGMPVTVSNTTSEIIKFALDMAKRTNGVLDPTIYPVLTTWGFTTDTYQIPTEDELTSALAMVGYENVKTEENSVSMPNGVQLDLGAVAKGYTGDILSQMLKDRGITSALLNLGGNVQAIGAKPDGSKWRVGLRDPSSESNIGILEIEDQAVITSGNYQKYFEGDDGKRYHHIIDTATGYPAESGIVSATVIGKEGKMCDALSTALFIMGVDKATDYWRANGNFEMILITDENKLYLTEGISSDFSLNEDHSSIETAVIER